MRRCSNGVLRLAIFAVFAIDGYSDASEPPLAAIESPADEQPKTTEALPLTAPVAGGPQTNALGRKSPTEVERLNASMRAVIEGLQQWTPEVLWDALPASIQRDLDDLMRLAVPQKPRKIDDRSRDKIWDLSLAETIHLALINNKLLRIRENFYTAGMQVLAIGDTVPTLFEPAIQDSGLLFGTRGEEGAPSPFDAILSFSSTDTGNVLLQDQQPLWGLGTEYRRVAGSINTQLGATPGVAQGVVISRINTDVSATNFELNVKNSLRDVEETYWDLYLAYRTYDINVEARNSFLRTWRLAEANKEVGKFGDLDELQARQAYFQGRAACEDALQNLYRLETQLRRLCALPGADDRLIRTKDDPNTGEYIPDWNLCLAEAWTRREELRREKWNVKSLEMQLTAAKSLARREPFGSRQALSQVRNSELRLAKAREVLAHQELEVCHELTTTFQNMASRFQAAQSNYNRWQIIEAKIAGRENSDRTGVPCIDTSVLLQQWITTRTEAATAEVKFYASLVEYQKALIDLHFCKGTLLELNNVHLAESSWTPDAYKGALHRALARSYGLDAPNADLDAWEREINRHGIDHNDSTAFP